MDTPQWLLDLWGGHDHLLFADSDEDEDWWMLYWQGGDVYLRVEGVAANAPYIGQRRVIENATEPQVRELMRVLGFGVPESEWQRRQRIRKAVQEYAEGASAEEPTIDGGDE